MLACQVRPSRRPLALLHMALAGATNNDSFSATRWLWLLGALLALALVRLWRLPEAGPVDYDSVRNWQVIQELAGGNFSHLFHHGSPGFLLFYVPVATVTRQFLAFQTLNALLGLVGTGAFCAWVAHKARLSGPLAAALVLLGGSSLLLTFSGRDFTMNSGSLVLFAGLVQSHYARLQQPGRRALLRSTAWLAAGLCFNYKFLFAIPILAALEIWQADGLWRRHWWQCLLVLAAPYVLLSALGVAVGLPWYRWVAFYWRTVVPAEANLAGRQGTVHLDVGYYPRYLLTHESPLLLLGLGASLWLAWRDARRSLLQRSEELLLQPYLLVWAACLLAGMSLLIKAPRGLLFAYLPLAALAVLAGRRLLPGHFLLPVLAVAVGLNTHRIQRELHAALPSRYAQVAQWLQTRHATKVASTVGQGLAPYLAPDQALRVVTDERQLAQLRQQGYQYVLLDGYWRVANISCFDSLRRQQPVAAWPAPELHTELLFLEHSEFTGLSFDQTLAAHAAAAADSLPLRLYRLR